MILYLVRHGIAIDREDPKCPPDTERPLTPRGMKRSHAAALGLLAMKIKPDVTTSPWLRITDRRNLLRSDWLLVQENHSDRRAQRNGHARGTPS